MSVAVQDKKTGAEVNKLETGPNPPRPIYESSLIQEIEFRVQQVSCQGLLAMSDRQPSAQAGVPAASLNLHQVLILSKNLDLSRSRSRSRSRTIYFSNISQSKIFRNVLEQQTAGLPRLNVPHAPFTLREVSKVLMKSKQMVGLSRTLGTHVNHAWPLFSSSLGNGYCLHETR